MLKLEIKLDEGKISKEQKYSVSSVYYALEEAFNSYHLRKDSEPDGTIVFYGSGDPRDYGAFGCIITSLKEKSWFMDYVIKWIWYNIAMMERMKMILPLKMFCIIIQRE